jgi:hypothetical protein
MRSIEIIARIQKVCFFIIEFRYYEGAKIAIQGIQKARNKSSNCGFNVNY